jgi:alpha-glucosidase
MFGSAFLVAPFEGYATTTFGKVYFPAGKWYDLYNGEVQNGGQQKILQLSMHKLPVYVKESSIIPMQSLVQTTAQQPTDTLTLNIYQGNINNRFTYYEDDGESYAYEGGAFYKRVINYNAAKKTITFDKADGSLKSKFNNIKVVFHGFGNGTIKMGGKQIAVQDDFVSYINPLTKFDPQGVANPVEGEKVSSIVIKNTSNLFSISY